MWKLPEKQAFVLEKFAKNGYSAYLVGGCVRDYLMGKTPHDYDIATSATPNSVEKLFEKVAETGIKHGTVTVIVDKEPIEVTTFRTEGEYKDSRHPERVDFVTDIKKDLSRRDFTVNAIAYNETDGFIDPFGGMADIKSKTLRAVGNPTKRFTEDALRILRLFRFASTLGFCIEKQTLTAALSTAKGLEKISAERVTSELLKTLKGANFAVISPLIQSGGLKFSGIEKAENTEKISLLRQSLPLRLFALYENCADGEKQLEKLKLSSETSAKVRTLFTISRQKITPEKAAIKRLLRDYGCEAVTDILNYKKVFSGYDTSGAEKLLKEVLENGEPYRTSDLKINGSDILSLNITGETVGKTLNELLNRVIENPTLNTKENLINLIRN